MRRGMIDPLLIEGDPCCDNPKPKEVVGGTNTFRCLVCGTYDGFIGKGRVWRYDGLTVGQTVTLQVWKARLAEDKK